ncbi:hypothetical protein PL373_13625 [Tenacibaculum maritimum]|nr:hypothetical protein [Tenacibaculum maritimum]MDB0602169.1 hypothetical protein [Tenacibaculum maritimum]MDB0613845.1 hypothetical protein [Tenacibaculum maritimum]
MKKILLILAFICVNSFVFSQETINVDFTAKLYCSQKRGLETTKGDFVLTVVIDGENMRFNTAKNQTMTSYQIKKKSDKYIIGQDDSGNYSFYNKKNKQFYNIDYFMSRYSTSGFGNGYSSIKQTVLKMMNLLKKGKTQKDVIQHLIKQTEYDF